VPGADIDATQAWDRSTGDPTTVVADIDTGYFFEDPELARALPGGDTLYNNDDATDDPGVFGISDGEPGNIPSFPGQFVGPLLDSHGVHTAGTIGAQGNNGIGVSGVDPNATIMPIRALDSLTGGTDATVVAAINYAGTHGARVVNMSLGAPGPDPMMLAAQAAYPQMLFVVAAGNSSSNDDTSPVAPCDNPTVAVTGYTPPPGAIDNVVCVAATDPADNLPSFSDYGPTSVDLAARASTSSVPSRN
jgi:serine protease